MNMLFDFEPAALGSLSASQATALFSRILWCAANRQGIPVQHITITQNVNVPDGGIDAVVTGVVQKPISGTLLDGSYHYQLKAGASANPWRKAWLQRELFGTKQPSKDALGEAIRDCMAKRGRYVLVCFGCDPNDPQRRKAIKYLAEFLQKCGYKDPHVDVWGQSTIAGMMQPFPSLKLRLTNRDHLPFLTYEEWKKDSQMTSAVHLGTAQRRLVDRIRVFMRDSKKRHVRLIGEPGLGKTRLILEALSPDDLASPVIYIRHPEDFERSPLFNTIIRADDASFITLVIDDCPQKERASIWNVLRQRSDRIRIISADHDPEHVSDDLMEVLQCPSLEPEQIKTIIADYIGNKHDLDRWSAFCSGSPRVAHAIGQNLSLNRGEILKSPATVPIWDRFVHGSNKTGSTDNGQFDTVLRHIALFKKFGFEHPVVDEAKFISSLIEQADPTITWAKFQSIIKHFRDRRILQGKRTLFLVPKLLHVYLWAQFWEHYGHGNDLKKIIETMPESLLHWFGEMFKYGRESPAGLATIERLTSPGGIFDDQKFLTAGPGPNFLNDIAEAHPEAALCCIQRTIGTWSHADLVDFSQRRQYLVWALEKIAMRKDLFHSAVMMLLKLALAENASNSNNATGMFCSLFGMGFEDFAPTAAPPQMRLQTLHLLLSSSDRATRSLALRAVAQGLTEHPTMHIIGPQHQGLQPVPELWTPKTWGEVFEAYNANLKLVVEFWRSARGDDRKEATKVLSDAAFWLLQNRWSQDAILTVLDELAADTDHGLAAVIRITARFRVLKWQSLSRKAAIALRRMEKNLEGKTIDARIRRYLLCGTYDDLDPYKNGVYGSKHAQLLRGIARDLLNDPARVPEMISLLSSSPGFSIYGFGRVFGDRDSVNEWLPAILCAFLAADDLRKNPDFAAGYLSSIAARDQSEWEEIVIRLLDDARVRPHARSLIVSSGLSDRLLDALCAAFERGELDESAFPDLGFLTKHGHITTPRCLQYIRWCVERGNAALVHTALETAQVVFGYGENRPPLPEQPILDLLTSPCVVAQKVRDHQYAWSELTKAYISLYPQHVARIFENVLEGFENFDHVLAIRYSLGGKILTDLIRLDRRASWNAVARRLERNDDLASHIKMWLGPQSGFGLSHTDAPISAFDPQDVLDWINADPSKRAPLIISECPQSMSPIGDGYLTREILVRYGDRHEVRRGLWQAFGSDGWSGPASEHFREKRDMVRQWLANENVAHVAEWLMQYIASLDREIESHEIREEREY